MSSSFDFEVPDHVTADAIGPPGQRVFYLQARQGDEVVSLRLEKQQVAALCDYLSGILADLAVVTEPVTGSLDLVEPVLAEWMVGALAVAYEESSDRILLVAEEFDPDAEVDEDDPTTAFEDLGVERDTATARFRLTRAQVQALVAHAARVVVAGRPPCPVCGHPMDPAGHFCPRNN